MSSQFEVFPLRIVSLVPIPRNNCAHASHRAVVENGDAYVVKGLEDPLVSRNEWILSYMAQALRLEVPDHAVLRMPTGELVFGSREVKNRLNALETSNLLFSSMASNEIVSPDFSRAFSELFAFDLAIGNPDRHLDNYLFSTDNGPGGNQRVARLRPIDFDQADIFLPEISQQPMSPKSHTVSNARQIASNFGFRGDVANALLERLEKGGRVIVENSLYGMPEEWLPAMSRQALMARVISPEFGARLAQVERGLSSGTYL